jgi:hypothetical protein
MKPALVEALIEAQGTHFFTIEFAKINGEVVTRNVRARMVSRRVGEDASDESKERAARQAAVLRRDGAVFLDYPVKGRGCQVKLDRVVSIKGQGATVAPR